MKDSNKGIDRLQVAIPLKSNRLLYDLSCGRMRLRSDWDLPDHGLAMPGSEGVRCRRQSIATRNLSSWKICKLLTAQWEDGACSRTALVERERLSAFLSRNT